MKYITVHDHRIGLEGTILFSETFQHAEIAQIINQSHPHLTILSAGFAVAEPFSVITGGASVSLGLESKPEDSTRVRALLTEKSPSVTSVSPWLKGNP